jgi:GH25 family lysozyme M1 (1,4-beta-N-acetylmuramidase)
MSFTVCFPDLKNIKVDALFYTNTNGNKHFRPISTKEDDNLSTNGDEITQKRFLPLILQ